MTRTHRIEKACAEIIQHCKGKGLTVKGSDLPSRQQTKKIREIATRYADLNNVNKNAIFTILGL